MKSRAVIIKPNNFYLKTHKVLLTDDQIKLLNWLKDNNLLCTDATYIIAEQEESISRT